MHVPEAVLASDLDGTLIPPGTTPGDGGVGAFRDAVDGRRDLALTYVTGRHRALALDGIRSSGLPFPRYLACDVGTSLFVLDAGDYRADPAYADRVASALGAPDMSEVARALRSVPDLVLQSEERQSPFKLSYDTPGGHPASEVVRRVEATLAEAAPRTQVVFSIDPETGGGLLDVLPAGVAKDTAVAYVRNRTGVADDALVYAGDSGNDRAAMLSGWAVVVVGNARARLKSELRDEARRRGLLDRFHFAEAPYAAGVVEGMRHFALI